MNNRKYFRLFANCLPVKGYKRSIICDLQKARFEFIPNDLYFVLTKFKGKEVKEIKKRFPSNDAVIDEYFDFLEAEGFGIWFEKYDRGFVELNLDYETPELITNAILEVDRKHNFKLICEELNDVRCKALQIRFLGLEISRSELEEAVMSFSDSTLRSIEIIMPYSRKISEEWLESFIIKNIRITNVVLHAAGYGKSFMVNDDVPVEIIKKNLDYKSCCGFISPHHFRINIAAFTQSLHFNSCLYKKISITKNGTIKNCPSMEQSFGRIGNVSLRELSLENRFKKMWGIKKDDIRVCRDCEFRYICSDCRAFTENELNKPVKCNYDPYTASWK